MTKDERNHLERVARLGCIICGGDAEIHHIRTGCGMSQRASNYHVIPLCAFHHRQGPFGDAIHNGHKTFEQRYGTEIELLEQVRSRCK